MKTHLRWAACLVFLGFSLMAGAMPCGGEGPIPFINATADISLPVKALSSVGGVEEFVHWEKRESVVYRNSRNELRVSNFQDGSDTYLEKLKGPLARIVDPRERYLLAEGSNWFLDAFGTDSWIYFSSGLGQDVRLFWHSDSLYGLKPVKPLFGSFRWEVGRYVAGESSMKHHCTYTPPTGRSMKLAQGHRFPHAYFYQEVSAHGKTSVAFLRLNVLTCDMTSMGLPTEPLEGKVLEVHRFDKADAMAVRLDHPTRNFRWETPGKCSFLEIGDAEPVVPNHDRPLLVSWKPGKGVSLFNIDSMKTAEAASQFGIERLTERDLWVPSGESRLLMSPEMKTVGVRQMLEVEIEQLIPVAR